MRSEEPGAVTRALSERETASALDSVLPLVYDELRELAARTMGAGNRSLTLQPTALVHEAYLRLRNEKNGWSNRTSFGVAAAVAMRRALVDHIRRRNAEKRGGKERTRCDADLLAIEDRSFEVLAIEEALAELEKEDPESAQLAELRVFGGLSGVECAEALGVSTKTVQRRWRFARAWLVAALEEPADA